jgi:hypothetical protein
MIKPYLNLFFLDQFECFFLNILEMFITDGVINKFALFTGANQPKRPKFTQMKGNYGLF